MATSMNVKAGTKTWNEAPGGERDLKKATALTDEQKAKLGADDIGAVLNKTMDPNWVDDGKVVKGKGNPNLDKDAFFKLMLTQLKNQDPMNPLKNHEMAAQLAQFSTLEQMSNMNSTLQKMEGKSSEPANFQALTLIGKTVAGDSSKVVRTQFDKTHDFHFNLPQDSSEATVKIFDDKGEMVREYKLSNLKAGDNKLTWNGQNDKGAKASVGEYQFKVEAKNSAGQKLAVKSDFSGVITGMSFSPEGPVLQVGSQSIKMRDVRQITDSSAKLNDQKSIDVSNLDLKNSEPVGQANVKQEANTSNTPMPPGMVDIKTGVAMSRDVYNKLQKETK
ncbi:MAG: flagellar biosynthesis protein FlgD [Bdellovibrionaceae bacterium]|nr:flagellar biosynthesis protein FlgD [Bdellovibrio sp.]